MPERRYIFDYLLRTQDVPGAALVIFIAIAAAWPPLARAGLALVEAIGRKPWATALACISRPVRRPAAGRKGSCARRRRAPRPAAGEGLRRRPPDGRVSARARLLGRAAALRRPVALRLADDRRGGLGVLAGVRAAARAVRPAGHSAGPAMRCSRAARSLLIGRLAGRLTGAPQAAGWAMLFALASPAFTGMALGYFSMTAHCSSTCSTSGCCSSAAASCLPGSWARSRSSCTIRAALRCSRCRGSSGSRWQ